VASGYRRFHVAHLVLLVEAVVGHRDGRAVKRVGLEDVGAGVKVVGVDLRDDVRPRQHEDVVVALQLSRAVLRAMLRCATVAAGGAGPPRATLTAAAP
jgi:hypothetical protein